MLRNVLALAHIIGQIPIQGSRLENPNGLRFTYKSCLTIYCALLLSGTIFTLSILTFRVLIFGSDLFVISSLIYYLCNLGITLAFIHVAKKWPNLMQNWQITENRMKREYTRPYDFNTRTWITIAVVFLLFIVEHLGDIFYKARIALKCTPKGSNSAEFFYVKILFATQFSVLPYHPILAAIFHFLHFIVGFTSSFADAFIVIMASAIALQFKQINERLEKIPKRVVEMEERNISNKYADGVIWPRLEIILWREIREDYNRLSILCRLLDDALSGVILMSYSTNVFFILIKLFHSLRLINNIEQKISFFFSFGCLILRTVTVSSYAAWVNDESKQPLLLLNSIPSHFYNSEIRRFVQQISFDLVALTGRNLFVVTRGLILNISGAIVTYELVLIQFNEKLLDGEENYLHAC